MAPSHACFGAEGRLHQVGNACAHVVMVFVFECLSGKAERDIDFRIVDFERGEREAYAVAVYVFWRARKHIFEDLRKKGTEVLRFWYREADNMSMSLLIFGVESKDDFSSETTYFELYVGQEK
jgi:hypothetical protein